MFYVYLVIAALSGLVIGAVTMAFIISRDESLMKVDENHVVVMKPQENHVLVQVTPDVLRRMVLSGNESDQIKVAEARNLYPEKAGGKLQYNPGSTVDNA